MPARRPRSPAFPSTGIVPEWRGLRAVVRRAPPPAVRAGWLLPAGLLAAAALWLFAAATPLPRHGRQLFGAWGTRDFAFAGLLAWLAVLFLLHRCSRRALFAGAFASLLAAATVGMLEVAGRAGLADYATLFGLRHTPPLGSQRIPNALVRGEADEDIAALWRIPRAKVPFEYRTDRHGLRNAHDRDAADVYCLGDSFLVAGLLPFDDTLTARLERTLNVPTMNVALVGLGVQEVRALWHELDLPAEGRTVLQFVTEDNDLVDSARFRQGRKSWEIDQPTARSFLDSFTVWLQRLTQPVPGEARTHVGLIGGEPVAFQWGASSFAGLRHEVAEVIASIAALHREVAAAGGRHGVVFLPAKLRVLGPRCTWPKDSALRDLATQLGPLRDALIRECAARGIPLLDLTPALQAAAATDLPYFPFDTHFNAVGHAVAAQAIAAWSFVARR